MGGQRGVREPVRLPPLLMTKLHPPPRREADVARDQSGRAASREARVKLTSSPRRRGAARRRCSARGASSEETARPVAWVSLDEGDNDPVVLWSYVLAALRGCLSDARSGLVAGGARSIAHRGHLLAGAGQRVDGSSAMPRWSSTISIGSRAAPRATAWRGSSTAPPRRSSSSSQRGTSRLSRWARCAHTGICSSCGRDDLGFTVDEADLLLNDRLELGLEPRVRPGSRRADRGLGRRALPRGALAPGGGRSTRVREQVRRREPPRRRLPRRRGARGTRSGDAGADAPFLGPRADVRPAVRRGARTGGLRRSCWPRSPAPTCSSCRSTTRASGIASIISSPSCCASSSSIASRAWRRRSTAGHSRGIATTARSTTAIEHALEGGAFAEAGELIAAAWIDYVNVARHATVLAWLERFPRELVQRRPAAPARPGVGAVPVREARGRLPTQSRRSSGWAASTQARCPTASARVEASLATLRATIPWGDFGAGLENARRAAELEGPTSPWRPLVACSLGACLYFSGEFDEAARWLAESTGPALAYRQWRVAVSALASRSLVAGELRPNPTSRRCLRSARWSRTGARSRGRRRRGFRRARRIPRGAWTSSTRRLRSSAGRRRSRAPRVIRA